MNDQLSDIQQNNDGNSYLSGTDDFEIYNENSKFMFRCNGLMIILIFIAFMSTNTLITGSDVLGNDYGNDPYYEDCLRNYIGHFLATFSYSDFDTSPQYPIEFNQKRNQCR